MKRKTLAHEHNINTSDFEEVRFKMVDNGLGKIQEMLLAKLIQFECLDMDNSEALKKKLYNFFFNWQKEATDDQTVNMDLVSDSRGGRGNMSDDAEEKRKRLQLKLDSELIEFEERGGFA